MSKRRNYLKSILILIVMVVSGVCFVSTKSARQKLYTSIPDLKERVKKVKKLYPRAKVIVNDDMKPQDATDMRLFYYLQKEFELGYDEADSNKNFYNSTEVVADRERNIYVAFLRPTEIRKYDRGGNFCQKIGGQGQGPGEFSGILKLQILDDTLYTFDKINSRVSQFDLNGNFLGSVQLNCRTSDVGGFCVSQNPNYYILSSYISKEDKVIHCLTRQGVPALSFGETLNPKGTIGHLDEELNRTCSIGRLATNNRKIYFSRFNPYEIRVYGFDSKIERAIFRKNQFMPKDRYKLHGESVTMTTPSLSYLIAPWGEIIVNCVALANYCEYPFRTVIDFFDKEGELKLSLGLKDWIYFTSMSENFLYGIKIDQTTNEHSVVCYSVQKGNP